MTAKLTEDIAKLSELLTANGWTELRVRVGDTEILLSTDRNTASLGTTPATPSQSVAVPTRASELAVTVQTADGVPATDPNWIAVEAPNLGTFYRSPKPGAAPFVQVGDAVAEDTEICLLEVMKLFTSVKAGKVGTVRKICVDDAELVETGQVLFYISADES